MNPAKAIQKPVPGRRGGRWRGPFPAPGALGNPPGFVRLSGVLPAQKPLVHDVASMPWPGRIFSGGAVTYRNSGGRRGGLLWWVPHHSLWDRRREKLHRPPELRQHGGLQGGHHAGDVGLLSSLY